MLPAVPTVGKQPFVRGPARHVTQRRLETEERRELLLERAVDVERAADEAHGRRAGAVAFETRDAGRNDVGLVGEPEIVVAREHDDVARFFHRGVRRPSAS